VPERHYLFDWGDTLMADSPGQPGPMCDWPEVRLVEGASECLAGLSQVAPCHLATNARDSDEASIRRALQRAGIDGFLQRIFCFRQVGHMKPTPSYFQHIVTALGCMPGEIVMVGDSLHSDVLGAMSCGLQAVWFNPEAAPVPTGVTAITSLLELGDS
jgi:FMN phosphatase YigB (HAD superfamily)